MLKQFGRLYKRTNASAFPRAALKRDFNADKYKVAMCNQYVISSSERLTRAVLPI